MTHRANKQFDKESNHLTGNHINQEITANRNQRKSVFLGGGILLFAMFMSLYFIYAIPPFENPDEFGHVAHVMHLIQNKSLPRVEHKRSFLPAGQGFQPPFYYLSCVPIALLKGTDFTPERPPRNRKFKWKPVLPGEGEHRKYKPLTKNSTTNVIKISKLCILLRWISLFWGMLTGILLGRLLWRLSGESTPLTLAGLSLFALNPRWIETCASVTNDVAATCMATLVILLLVEFVLSGKGHSFVWSITLGVLCALAALTKLNCAGLIPIAIIIILFASIKSERTSLKRSFLSLTVFSLGIIVLWCPWLLRNYLIYDHVFAIVRNIEKPFSALRTEPMGPLAFFSQEFQGLRYSYWAVFGQFGVLAHAVVYKILDVVLITGGILGSLFFLHKLIKSKDMKYRVVQTIPLSWIFIIFTSFLYFNRMIFASQGRLLFPAAGCIAYFLAGGFIYFIPRNAQKFVTLCITLMMVTFCLYSLFFVLIPAFKI